MTELDTLIRAESYIRKMANGINPITDETAADDDMVNNVRITRCLYYVRQSLRGVVPHDTGSKTAVSLAKSDQLIRSGEQLDLLVWL